jgi:hypothetical protein
MRVLLVASYTRPYALGLRYISSRLKAAGHAVQMIFMSSGRDGRSCRASQAKRKPEKCQAQRGGAVQWANTARRRSRAKLFGKPRISD